MLTAVQDIKYLRAKGVSRIIGIDEAGRGAWAGPLAVGYFCLELKDLLSEGVKDSKKLSRKVRESLFPKLEARGGVVLKSSYEIDKYGLGVVLNNTIAEIVDRLNNSSTFFIIDGNFASNFGTNTIKIPKADDTFYSVAAASILAKVTRDRIMSQYSIKFPGYGFDSNVGYGTKVHRDAISKLGKLVIHRKSFKF